MKNWLPFEFTGAFVIAETSEMETINKTTVKHEKRLISLAYWKHILSVLKGLLF